MSKNDRHVVPSPNGGWDVKAPGAERVTSHHNLQSAAIDAARTVVHNQGGGELVVHDRHGQIREKDTIAPAVDPYPPKG